jgi:hypothetical protein
MVKIEPGQFYAYENEDGGTDHLLVLDIIGEDWSSARAMVYMIETGGTFNVHARTLWRMCELLL